MQNFIPWLLLSLAGAAALIGLARFRRLTPPMRYLAILACFDITMELTVLVLARIAQLKSNLFMFPIVLTGELALVALLYRQVLQSAAFNRAVPWIIGFFGLYGLLDQLTPHAAVHYFPGLQVLDYLLTLGMVWLYFRKLLNDLQVEHLRKEPVFWFSVGLTVYALGNLLIALFSNYILAHCSYNTQIVIIIIIRNLFNIELYLCYSIALWMRPQK